MIPGCIHLRVFLVRERSEEKVSESSAILSGKLDAGDRDQFKRLAHRLAGSFGLYGFRWVSVQCKALERNAEAGDAASLTVLSAAVALHLDQAEVRFVPSKQE